VQIDCLNVKRANDLAQLFGKEGHVQKGIKFKSMLTKARPVDEKILDERLNPARRRRIFLIRTVS
jgi:hypothetical protein